MVMFLRAERNEASISQKIKILGVRKQMLFYLNRHQSILMHIRLRTRLSKS